MDTEILEILGFTRGESKVYLALLKHGTLTTGPIAKYSGITHSKIYKILDKLSNRGLTSHILKGKTKYFNASDPNEVLKLINDKKETLSKREEEFKEKLPFLRKIAQKSREESKVEVFEGFQGLKTVFGEILDTLKKGDTLHTIGVPKAIGQLERYFYHFFKEQAKKGFRVKAIFNKDAKDSAKERENKYTSFKFMPKGVITPTAINIYTNKTIINTRSEKEQFFTIVITSKETADSYKNYFDMLWKTIKE